ncbi:hypothetical protein [Desulfosarcina ovata]|nr:hypothetical protein [Desulfosarcina ovata]
MRNDICNARKLINNARGGAAGVLIALVLVLAIAAGGGYCAYTKYYKKEPLRTKLGAVKMKPEIIRFVHDAVSPALYHNLITLDDIVVMMNKEMDRLKRIAKQFPDQRGIIDPQTQSLTEAHARLAKSLTETGAQIEKMFVSWLVDRKNSIAKINSQKGTLTRQLANAIRGENELVSRIRANPDSAS